MSSQNRRNVTQYRLRVSRNEVIKIDEIISEMHARIIGLLALAGGKHCEKHPEHLSFIMATMARTIEAALQQHISSHSVWLNLCEDSEQAIQVDLESIRPASSEPPDPSSGGTGGSGGWFGGGGGGGGTGLFYAGAGGAGADGAAFVLQIAEDNSPLDVDALVTPGTSDVDIRPGAHTFEIILVGGGGGGAAGGRWIDLARSPRLSAIITSQSGLTTET
jgi:hypothetical protein